MFHLTFIYLFYDNISIIFTIILKFSIKTKRGYFNITPFLISLNYFIINFFEIKNPIPATDTTNTGIKYTIFSAPVEIDNSTGAVSKSSSPTTLLFGVESIS